MSLPLRHRLLAGAVLLTALATGYVASLPDDDAPLTGHVAAPERPRPVARETRRDLWPAADAEALRAWGHGAAAPSAPAVSDKQKASIPRVAAAPAPAASAAVPRAPAPPWRFIGRIDESGQVRALLAAAQSLHVVGENDRLDKDWQVERIGEQAVDLLWLPGAQRVRLAWVAS